MTVYCPNCNSDKLDPQGDPIMIDSEIDQVLLQQLERCSACGYEWVDKWWEVWTPDGIENVTVSSEPYDRWKNYPQSRPVHHPGAPKE